MIEKLQIALIIPKSIEAILFLIVIIKLWKKYQGVTIKNRPQLNKLFLIGLFSWFIYITLDIGIFILAPLSFDSDHANGLFVGYLQQYPSLLYANIIRDIGFLGLSIISWSYFIAGFSIRYGEKKTKKIFFENKIVLGSIILFTLMFDIIDQIGVEIRDGEVNTHSNGKGVAGFFLVVVIVLFIMGATMLNTTLKSTVLENQDQKYRKKVRFLMFGVILMAAGDIYWVFLSIIRLWPPFTNFVLTKMNYEIFYWFGHILWMFSPLFIYYGLKEIEKK